MKEKMKIFCYVGSNSKDSVGAYMANCLEDILQKKKFETSFYKGSCCNINLCKGCRLCFNEGKCPLESVDDIRNIKRDMIEADVVLWISPVYANNVSGTMKNYIDRISEWLHTMELAGKLGGVIAITDKSGAEFVNFYNKNILTYMGCNVIIEDSIIKTRMEETVEKKAKAIVNRIEEALEQEEQYFSNQDQEAYFSEFRKKITAIMESEEKWRNFFEVRKWNETKMITCKNFQEVLNMKRKNKI